MNAPHKAPCIMVLGTSSGAGKSWLTTALCRHYARHGLKIVVYSKSACPQCESVKMLLKTKSLAFQ